MAIVSPDSQPAPAWAGLLVGAGGFVIILVLVLAGLSGGICCCRRRRRGYSYSSIGKRQSVASDGTSVTIIGGGHGDDTVNAPREPGFYEALKQQQEAEQQGRRDTALLNCQFFLRSTPNLTLEHQLPDIGSRMSKKWFLVRQARSVSSSASTALLTMVPLSSACKLEFAGDDKELIHQLIHALQHPFVHKVTMIDFIADKNIVVIVEPFSEKGSLKDLIYNTTPNLGWASKYSVRRHGLKLSQVRMYGRQILEGLLHMHSVGMSPVGQLQSGNVYIFNNKCKVSGYENGLLGYKPRIHNLIKREKNIDTAMFGHLLYEMASGRELSVSRPSDTDLQRVKQSQVLEVLRFIFDGDKDSMPSLQQVLQLQFFQQANVPELINWSYEEVQLSDEVRSLIRRAKRGRSRPANVGTAKRKKKEEKGYPVFQGGPSSLQSTTPQQPPAVSQPPISSSCPNDPPPAPPSSTKSRNALLSNIRRGSTLRPTITDDRSAPII